MAEAGGRRKTFVGSVISDKMDKTVVVSIERLKKHPLYGKYLKRRVKYVVHDEKEIAKPGDKVLIVETRPISKLKRWRVKEVLEKAK
jgi:small subunit ribosomal protein S17